MRSLWLCLFLCGLVLSGVNAQAGSIAITNYSFETPTISPGGYVPGSVTGWTGTGLVGVTNLSGQNKYSVPFPDGNNVAFINGSGSFEQDLAGVTVSGGLGYTLSVWLGVRNDDPASLYQIQLLANGTPLTPSSSVNPTLVDYSGTFSQATETYSASSLAPYIGEPLSINLTEISGGQLDFDLVQLQTATPEPGSLTLLLAGALLAAVRLRRRA